METKLILQRQPSETNTLISMFLIAIVIYFFKSSDFDLSLNQENYVLGTSLIWIIICQGIYCLIGKCEDLLRINPFQKKYWNKNGKIILHGITLPIWLPIVTAFMLGIYIAVLSDMLIGYMRKLINNIIKKINFIIKWIRKSQLGEWWNKEI